MIENTNTTNLVTVAVGFDADFLATVPRTMILVVAVGFDDACYYESFRVRGFSVRFMGFFCPVYGFGGKKLQLVLVRGCYGATRRSKRQKRGIDGVPVGRKCGDIIGHGTGFCRACTHTNHPSGPVCSTRAGLLLAVVVVVVTPGWMESCP